MRVLRVAGALVAVCLTMAFLAVEAGAAGAATIAPSLTLSPGSETAASTHDLGTDITFGYSPAGTASGT